MMIVISIFVILTIAFVLGELYYVYIEKPYLKRQNTHGLLSNCCGVPFYKKGDYGIGDNVCSKCHCFCKVSMQKYKHC